MKKIVFSTLLSLSALAPATSLSAAELDTNAWDRYCETHKEECMQAGRICEQSAEVKCDQVKMAIMENRPLTKEMVPWKKGD